MSQSLNWGGLDKILSSMDRTSSNPSESTSDISASAAVCYLALRFDRAKIATDDVHLTLLQYVTLSMLHYATIIADM